LRPRQQGGRSPGRDDGHRHRLPAGQLSPDVAQHPSIFFGISAIAGWVQPSTGDLLDAGLDTPVTFWGAVCFFVGAALLLAQSNDLHRS
jgi:hypothetical protein